MTVALSQIRMSVEFSTLVTEILRFQLHCLILRTFLKNLGLGFARKLKPLKFRIALILQLLRIFIIQEPLTLVLGLEEPTE